MRTDRYLFPQIVYIDLLNLDEAAAKQALLDGVRHGRAKLKAKPVFPSAPSRTIAREPDFGARHVGLDQPRFPGTMPAIWNIPFLRNQHFTGREDELAELRASLECRARQRRSCSRERFLDSAA